MAKYGITPQLKDINYQNEKKMETPTKKPEPIQQSEEKLSPSPDLPADTADKKIKKPVERFLTAEAKEKGIQELDYFIESWGKKFGLAMAYQMYEDQFEMLEKKGIYLKPKNLLKAV